MTNIFFIIPAGGVGSRMQADRPKQYLELINEQTVLETTINIFQNCSYIRGGVLGISNNDEYFTSLQMNQNKFTTYSAGETRSHTVFFGLQALSTIATDNDWVIVHDAARPGLSNIELQTFIQQVTSEKNSVGGIMALPAVDTVKQVNGHEIQKTIDRDTIYLAQTPQMFRYNVLRDAYAKAIAKNLPITDEASAIEALGRTAYVYKGYAHNFKITHPIDLHLMRFILKERELCE